MAGIGEAAVPCDLCEASVRVTDHAFRCFDPQMTQPFEDGHAGLGAEDLVQRDVAKAGLSFDLGHGYRTGQPLGQKGVQSFDQKGGISGGAIRPGIGGKFFQRMADEGKALAFLAQERGRVGTSIKQGIQNGTTRHRQPQPSKWGMLGQGASAELGQLRVQL